MKRILIYSLLSMMIVLSTGGISSAFTAPIIPKPDLLPGPPPESQTTSDGSLSTRTMLVDTVIPQMISKFVAFTGGLSVLFMIIGGVMFAVSYGNDELRKKATTQVTYALIGFILSLLAYSIVTIIINLRFVPNT